MTPPHCTIFVTSHLECMAHSWFPHHAKHTEKLETIQYCEDDLLTFLHSKSYEDKLAESDLIFLKDTASTGS